MQHPAVRLAQLRAQRLATARVTVARAVIALLAGVLCITPQRVHAQSSNDTSFAIPRNAVIDITMRSGRLVVRGSDRSTAELRADDQRYELRSTGVGVTLTSREDRSRSDNDRRGSRDSRLELSVPRGVRVVVSAYNADVDVQEIAGDVEVHTTSGDVLLRAIGGRAIVETLSGEIKLTEGAGETRATTMSGDIELSGVRGSADVHTTSGEVSMTGIRANVVRVESMSGDIVFDGELPDDARIQLITHSGDVGVRLPDAARGVLELSTFNGDLSANHPLTLTAGSIPVRDRRERGTQRFEFGGGGAARLSITTFNGDVQFDRATRRDFN